MSTFYYSEKQILSPSLSTLILTCVVTVAIILRLFAFFILSPPLESDPLGYFTIARGMAEHGTLADLSGQHAFMSAGYPLLLAPFFAALGSSVSIAIAVNLWLTAISMYLISRLAVLLSGFRTAGVLAAAAFGLWMPGIWNATLLAKENLSTPLLLAIALCATHIAKGQRPAAIALVAGLLWGAAVVTGGSAVLLCLGIGTALIILCAHRFALAFGSGLSLLFGGLLVLTPWLYATNQMVGRPVLTTNAPFNLYLGNNPAATGKFVSIADTPLGNGWEKTRIQLGEIGIADRLQREALEWIRQNPAKAGQLALLKLCYFWEPNIPDAADFESSRVIAYIRVLEVIQYLGIISLGVIAFGSKQIQPSNKWIIATLIVAFWLTHAPAYIIFRYRDPVMPLLMTMATVPIAAWLERTMSRRHARDGS